MKFDFITWLICMVDFQIFACSSGRVKRFHEVHEVDEVYEVDKVDEVNEVNMLRIIGSK